MSTRREFLALGGAAALNAQQRTRPNIVIFLADDMGYADIGCFGARDIATPRIDALARGGVRLTECYSNGAVCTPTRCALMTGRYQQRYGRGLENALLPADVNVGLAPKHTTISRLLKTAGYRTAIFGKWHLGRETQFNPIHHGFDEYFGLRGGNVDMYSKEDRFRNYDLFEGLQPAEKQEGYLTELIAARAERFIEANRTQPFFLYVPFNAVHWPFQSPGRPGTVRKLENWYEGTRSVEYRAMLESMDAAIGRVMASLERNGIASNTLTIFTNDNGGERLSDGGPFRNHKATLWEGGIRVPGIVHWPGRLPKGKTSRQVAVTMDFTATVAAACGVRAADAEPFDGIDLTPVLSRRQPEQSREIFWRFTQPNSLRHRAVRSGKWKLLRDGNIDNLYDLSVDPGETTDQAYRRPAIAAQLREKIEAWEKTVGV